MNDPLNMIESLRRPQLLVRAARLGQSEFLRTRRLRRILAQPQLPASSGEVILRLMDLENDIDRARRARDAAYSPCRHVEVLTALISEARLLRAQRTEARQTGAQLNASATSSLRRAI